MLKRIGPCISVLVWLKLLAASLGQVNCSGRLHCLYCVAFFIWLHSLSQSGSVAEFKLLFFACSCNIVVYMDNCSLHLCCSTVCTFFGSMCTFYSSTFVTCQVSTFKKCPEQLHFCPNTSLISLL